MTDAKALGVSEKRAAAWREQVGPQKKPYKRWSKGTVVVELYLNANGAKWCIYRALHQRGRPRRSTRFSEKELGQLLSLLFDLEITNDPTVQRHLPSSI